MIEMKRSKENAHSPRSVPRCISHPPLEGGEEAAGGEGKCRVTNKFQDGMQFSSATVRETETGEKTTRGKHLGICAPHLVRGFSTRWRTIGRSKFV